MKIILSWSGGKDSMMALHSLTMNDQAPESLLTTFSGEFKRITMHGVREELLDQQAAALGLPVEKLYLPATADMKTYNHTMHACYTAAADKGVSHIGFGDINLEDLKNYRERQVDKAGLRTVFPVWARDTRELVEEFIDLGYRSVVVAVDGSKLSKEFAGRIIDKDFLRDLPSGVDPSGENGEFHSFVTAGPLFETELDVQVGECVERHYPAPGNKNEMITYYFQDLLPG